MKRYELKLGEGGKGVVGVGVGGGGWGGGCGKKKKKKKKKKKSCLFSNVVMKSVITGSTQDDHTLL